MHDLKEAVQEKMEGFGKAIMKSEVFNIDCMIGMKDTPDNYYDLAVVDPPYGIERFNKNMDSQGTLGKSIFLDKNKISKWDSLPSKEYFNQLFRVSKNQIIWGANHFWQTAELSNATNFIFWDKKMPFPNFSRGELAWTSFHGTCKCFEYSYYGNIEGNGNSKGRIHPTQKPVKLYEWIFKNYAEEGMKILDTHMGSRSSQIAAYNYKMGEYWGYETDKQYFDDGEKRFQNHISQLKLFA